MMLEAVVGVALRAILASVLLGGVLAALVLVATRTLSLTAATRHALWTTALVATAIMPLAGVGVSVARATIAATPPPRLAAQPAPIWGADDRVTVQHRGAGSQSTTALPAIAVPPPSASLADRLRLDERLAFAAWTPRVSRALALGVVGVWALGALIGLIGLAASVVRVRGLKRRSSPLDGTLADELPWLTEAGPGREIYLRLSYETETPVAIGFRRPVILIPTELATADGLSAIESLILHEHAHLRRNDDWTNLLQRAIERVFWFNPIVWFLGRRIALEREIASDDAVVEKTGEPHAYASSLWKLAREMRMPEHAVVAPGALLTRKQITVRIEQLLDKKRARLHRSPVAALGVALAGVASIAFVASSAPAVELPAPPVNTVAAAPAPAPHAARAAHGHVANAHQKRAPNHLAAAGKPAARIAANTAAAKSTSTAADAQSKAMQLQLKALREQLAAAQKNAGTVQRKMRIRIVDRAALDAFAPPPSTARVMPPAWREISALPAPIAVQPVAPMPVIAPAPPVMSRQTIARIHTLTASATRLAAHTAARSTARAGYEADVEHTIKAAMASIPQEVAAEIIGTHLRRTRFDGMKLTREMIASCAACSFRNADARGLDLHDLKLYADNFSGADMRGVNLAGAKLSGVSLAGANLASADLRGAQLNGVELRDATFDGAQLENVHLTGVSIRRISLKGTLLRSVVANCVACELSGLDLHGQDLHGLTLTGADFTHTDLHDANLSGVRFVSVDLSHANLAGADLTNAHFESCNLDGADMRNARTVGMIVRPRGSDG